MNRRQFLHTLAASSIAAAAPVSPSAQAPDKPASAAGFQLSVMLWTVFRDLPFEQRLEKVASAGYRNVELVGEYQKWSPADFARANAARARLGISFDATAGLAHGVGDPTARTAFLANLRQSLAVMETIACPAIIAMSGNVVPGLSRQAQHESCIEGLKRAAAMVEGRAIAGQPVRILLECIDPEENPKYFLNSASEAIQIVRSVNHPQVQFLYDLFHEQIAEGNLIQKLQKNIDVIGLIHVADVPGRHEPGTGEINYTNIYRKLFELNYQRGIAMEFLPTGDPIQALRQAKKALEASWPLSNA
ncbi:MAG TPA: TIM barrel protein [Terracidiphilus sp.]|jgi:hydroxypyruvate isomerase|nr:TIM barrel protein [Terracidiphilus sp.]